MNGFPVYQASLSSVRTAYSEEDTLKLVGIYITSKEKPRVRGSPLKRIF